MATLPSAETSVQSAAGANTAGTDVVCVISPVVSNPDGKPRQYGNPDAIYAFHGYSYGLEYAALHAAQTKKPIVFCGIPIATQGVVGRVNKAGNSNSSVATVSAGGSGTLIEHDGAVRVKQGGVVGTDQILLEYSLDGARSFKSLRMGTGNSFTFPYVGAALALGAGSLTAGDTIIEWHATAPKHDADGLALAFSELAAATKMFRSVVLCSGDLASSSEAQAFLDKLNDYETGSERFVYGRASCYDRLPYATMSHDVAHMVAGTSLTFAEVGASGDTITRSSGSWFTDGFAVGDTIIVTGSASNNITAVIASLSATVITLGTEDLAAETTVLASVVGYPTLTFAEVGGTGDTITRNRGSFIADGFRAGDLIVVSGTASNNIAAAQGLAGVTALVLTMGTDDLAAEVIRTALVTLTAGQLKSTWMAGLDAAFATIDGETARRISLSAGRGRKTSEYTGWQFRLPAGWAASLREYQHDLHVPPWRKKDGNTGFDLYDDAQNLVEWDDRADGEAGVAARFTTFRTWGNGPGGAFIALSLTRDSDGNLLSRTHNLAVVNLACSVTQQMTEDFIGETPELNDDGTATEDELTTLEAQVNAQLDLSLLTNRGEGKRASKAVWTASRDDVFNIAEPELHGTLTLQLKGTIHKVSTVVRVKSAGQ